MAGTAACLYLNRWAAAKPEKRPMLCIRGVIKPQKEVKEYDIPGVEPITFAGRMHFLPWLAEPKFEKWKREFRDPFHCKGPRLEEMPLHKTKPSYIFPQRIRVLEDAKAYANYVKPVFPGYAVAIIVLCGLIIISIPLIVLLFLKTDMFGHKGKAVIQGRRGGDPEMGRTNLELGNRGYEPPVEQH